MYNYNPYSQFNNQYNPYTSTNNYLNELQQMREKIDKQIQQAQQPQQQIQPMNPQPQVPQINQSFQLAPTTNTNSELESRYAENIDEVRNTFVMKTGIFAKKDYSIIWVKDVSGNITTFKTEEVKELDEKDLQIQSLQKELENMKFLMAQNMQNVSRETIVNETPVETKPKTTKSK